MACEISDVPIFSVHPVTLVCLSGNQTCDNGRDQTDGCYDFSQKSLFLCSQICMNALSIIHQLLCEYGKNND